MENPFVYGEVVPTGAFVDRVVELDRLVGDLAAGQKVFLISPRRYGKSSLVRQALAAMSRRGALTVDVTVSSFSSYVAFLEGYARGVVGAETRWDRARAWLRSAIASTPIEVGADSRVGFPNARTDRDISRLATEVFALPARLAEVRRRPVVVALDEFQAIEGSAAQRGEAVGEVLRPPWRMEVASLPADDEERSGVAAAYARTAGRAAGGRPRGAQGVADGGRPAASSIRRRADSPSRAGRA